MKAQNIFLDENTGGKGRYFKARILQPGLVKYSFGVCLLEKETIDKFVNDFVGCPVIIGHQDVTNQNADKLSRGNICHVWYDDKDGWYWVDGIIDNQEALNKIDEGYSVSCQYEITEYSNNTDNKLHNGNPYDKVILNGKPEHLAIVETPRYESAMIAVNAIVMTAENEDKWITIHPNGEEGKGRPLLVKEGETVKEAVEKKIAEWKSKKQKEKTEPKQMGLRGFGKLKKEGEKSNKEAEKKALKEKNAIRKKINDLREGYDALIERGEPEEWSKAKDYRDFKYDLLKRMADAEDEAKIKYGFSDDELEDFLEEKSEFEETQTQPEKSETEPKQEEKKTKKLTKKEKLENLKEFVKKQVDIDLTKYADEKYTELWGKGKGLVLDKNSMPKGTMEKIYDLQRKSYSNFSLEPLGNWAVLIKPTDKDTAKNSIIQAINELKDTDMFKSLFRKKEQEMNKDEMKQIFAECLQEVLIARNEEDEEKEKAAENEDEELEEELKVEEKAKNKKCKNEDVDKREIIRQIMAIAGKEEASEDVKTIAKLAEKLAYDKSEAGTADNGKKAKCEDDEEDKEEAKNKAKNAIDDLKGLFASAGVAKSASKYVTQSDAIELGNQLF